MSPVFSLENGTVTADCPECGWLDGNSERPSCPVCDSTGVVKLPARRASDRRAA